MTTDISTRYANQIQDIITPLRKIIDRREIVPDPDSHVFFYPDQYDSVDWNDEKNHPLMTDIATRIYWRMEIVREHLRCAVRHPDVLERDLPAFNDFVIKLIWPSLVLLLDDSNHQYRTYYNQVRNKLIDDHPMFVVFITNLEISPDNVFMSQLTSICDG